MYKYEKHVLAHLVKLKSKKLPVEINFKKELDIATSKNDIVFLFLLVAVIYDLECADIEEYEISPEIVLSFSEYCIMETESKMSYALRVSENQEFAYLVMDVILKVLDNLNCQNLTDEQANKAQLLYIVAKEIDYQTGLYYEEPLDRVRTNIETRLVGDLRRPLDIIKPFKNYVKLNEFSSLEELKTPFKKVDYIMSRIQKTHNGTIEYLTTPYLQEGVISDSLVFYDPEEILAFAKRDFVIMYKDEKEYTESFALIDKFLHDYVIRPRDVYENYSVDKIFWHIERRNKKTYLKAGTVKDLNRYIQPKYQTRGYDTAIEVVKYQDLVFESIPTTLFKESARSPIPAFDSMKKKVVKRTSMSWFLLILTLSVALNYAALSTNEITAKIHEIKEDITFNIEGGYDNNETAK